MRFRKRFSIVHMFVVVSMFSIPLALYRGYVEDQRFGIEPGQTSLPCDPQGFCCCGFWDDYELKRYIVGREDDWRPDDLD